MGSTRSDISREKMFTKTKIFSETKKNSSKVSKEKYTLKTRNKIE
jgi:hypothetical protein